MAMLCTAPRSLTSASGLAGAACRPASVPCAVRSRTSLAAIAASRRGTPPARRGAVTVITVIVVIAVPQRQLALCPVRADRPRLRLGADRRLQVFGIWPAVGVLLRGTRGRYLVDRRLPMPGRGASVMVGGSAAYGAGILRMLTRQAA